MMPKPQAHHDFAKAQQLRNQGYSLLEISKIMDINRWVLGANTVKPGNYAKMRRERVEPKPKAKRQVKPKPMPKRLKTKLDVKKEAKLNIGFSHIHKAEVKMTGKDRVFPDRDPRQERSVVVNNKTTVFVKLGDTRSDNEIREYYQRRMSN